MGNICSGEALVNEFVQTLPTEFIVAREKDNV